MFKSKSPIQEALKKYNRSHFFPFEPEDTRGLKLAFGILSLMLAFLDFFFPDPGRWLGKGENFYFMVAIPFGHNGFVVFEIILGLILILWSRKK